MLGTFGFGGPWDMLMKACVCASASISRLSHQAYLSTVMLLGRIGTSQGLVENWGVVVVVDK